MKKFPANEQIENANSFVQGFRYAKQIGGRSTKWLLLTNILLSVVNVALACINIIL